MVRREDAALTEQPDYAIGRMNEALPNWHTELYKSSQVRCWSSKWASTRARTTACTVC